MPCAGVHHRALIEDKRDIGNAIALNSSMFNAARLAGPSIAGAIIAVSNEGWCFLVDGISFLAVIGAAGDEPGTTPAPGGSNGPIEQLKGWRYAAGSALSDR
jgi:hypothetical protein